MQKEILVVDDQPGIRLLLTDIFENGGYKVNTAETGQEALDKIYKNFFDLIILDYKLPILDGLEVLNQLEQENVKIPAILMSGLVEEMQWETEKYSFLKEVIAKPFDVKAISDLVGSILNNNINHYG